MILAITFAWSYQFDDVHHARRSANRKSQGISFEQKLEQQFDTPDGDATAGIELTWIEGEAIHPELSLSTYRKNQIFNMMPLFSIGIMQA